MEIWDYSGQGQEELQSILSSKPNELFSIVDGAFLDLAVLTHCVCSDDSEGDEYDSDQMKLVDLRISAIAAYCDSKTNIDSQPMLDQLRAVSYWMACKWVSKTKNRQINEKPDEEMLLSRLRVLHGIEQRLKNHLYFTAGDTQRTAIEGEDRQKKREDELIIEIAKRDDGGLLWPQCFDEFQKTYPNSKTKNSEAFRKRYRDLMGNDYIRRKRESGRPSNESSK